MSRQDSTKISDVKVLLKMGANGSGIASIEKTGSSLNVDTYTITLDDGTKTTFTVTNGTSIASIEKTSTVGLVDTYTITLTDGSTSTFEVTNGEGSTASSLPYDNTISELTATNVQDAIDEIDATVDEQGESIDGINAEIDSIDAEIADMNNVLGAKNILPNSAKTVTSNGITFTVNANGTVKATGTATADAILVLSSSFYVGQGKKVILSGCPSGGSTSKYYIQMTNANGTTGKGNDIGNGVTITADANNLGCRIIIKSGQALGTSGKTFSPMVRLFTIKDSTYVPYVPTNKQLQDTIDALVKTEYYELTTRNGNTAPNIISSVNSNFFSAGYLTITRVGKQITVHFGGITTKSGNDWICCFASGFRPFLNEYFKFNRSTTTTNDGYIENTGFFRLNNLSQGNEIYGTVTWNIA